MIPKRILDARLRVDKAVASLRSELTDISVAAEVYEALLGEDLSIAYSELVASLSGLAVMMELYSDVKEPGLSEADAALSMLTGRERP